MSQQALPRSVDVADRSPGEDRRAEVRRPTRLRISYREVALDGVGGWEARLQDLSPLGAAVLMARPVQPGALLQIDLESTDLALRRPVLARVVHAQETDGGEWLVGCAFTVELDDLTLRRLHAERVRPTSGDARRWVRFPCNVETVCDTCETAPGERRRARLLNVSPGGVGLLLPCEFAAGTLLSLELPTAGEPAGRRALVRVVRAVEHGAGWFLGCEFVDRISEGDLELLLA